MRALSAKSVDVAQVFLIPDAKYSTLNEGCLGFEPVTSCHISPDIMSRNQLNQKL